MSGPRERAEEPAAQSAPSVVERVPGPARSEPALVAAGNSAVARGFGGPRSVPVGVHVARLAHAGNGAVSRALNGPAPGTAPGGFAERLGSAESGEPIPEGVRDDLESSFGSSLGDVRLHLGSRAGGLADEVNAKAFTVGKDIYFGQGRFDPSSSAGYHLLAHEVTHTQQQSGGSVSASSISVSDPGDASERDAERVAERLTAGRSAGPVSDEQPHVARSATDVIPDFILDGVKSAITAVPGYVLLTYIIGKDPITDRPVTASPMELVEKLLTYGPFGASVGQVLQAMDVLRDIYSMVTSGLAEHNLTVARIGHEISAAWDEISITNGIDGNIAVVRRHIDAILTDVAAFVRVMVNRVLEAVRKAAAEVAEPHLETPQIKPVWELAKKVFHYDPLRGTEVNAPTVEILGDFLHLIGKDEALAQLRERGTLQQAADWLDTQFATFIGIKNDVFALFQDAWNAISPENLPNLLNTLPQLAQRAWALVQRIAAFAATVVGKVLELIKNALLGYLSAHASEIPGFRLLTVMIEQNPFTGQAVPRTAENLIGGFIALLPNGEATYQKLAESGVIAQAAGRITSAMTRLGITVELITSTFRGIWDSLSLEDLAAPLAAFERVMARFRDPLNRIVEFVTEVVKVVIELILKLMNFPSDLLGSIIDNATRAIDDIEKDPVAFLMNMLEALKRGFLGFFDGIVGFLVEGLGAWLFRGLGAMGITRPPDLSLKSILDLTLQVLGISVDMLWQRLALQIGPERVAQMRGAVDTLTGAWAFLKEVQQDGVAAIWRHVESMLGNLWETILNLAKNWIMTEIVDRVIAKIISMLDPTGIMAIINSFIAFFKAIQSAIDYLRDILEIVNQYVTTFAQVAAGNIVPGAEKITRGLANAVPIAIGFLANQVGLGNVPEKVVEIIGGLREMIMEAVDWLIKQALSLGQSIMSGLGLGGDQPAQQPADPAAAAPVDPSNHDALADRVIGELSSGVTPDEDYQQLRTEKEAQAKTLENLYTPMLQPGIKLRVNFAPAAADAADNALDFEVVIAPNDTRKKGKVAAADRQFKLENGALHIDDRVFAVGDLIQLKTSGRDTGRGKRGGLRKVPYRITALLEVVIGGARRINVSFAPDTTNPRYTENTPPGGTVTADTYGKQWGPVIESSQDIDDDEMPVENAKDIWDTKEIAVRVLNYRVTGNQGNNPPGMDWEHIVEQGGSHTEHSLRNMCLTEYTINRDLNSFYQLVRRHEPLVMLDITEPISLREYVYGKDYDTQRHFKVEYAYRELRLSLKPKNNDRGKWQELTR